MIRKLEADPTKSPASVHEDPDGQMVSWVKCRPGYVTSTPTSQYVACGINQFHNVSTAVGVAAHVFDDHAEHDGVVVLWRC